MVLANPGRIRFAVSARQLVNSFIVLCMLLALPVEAAEFTVNSTSSAGDAVPGDGVCEASTGGPCTLRAAIEETNELAGADTIHLPANVYTALWSITDAVELLGAGSATTFINGATLGVFTDQPVIVSGLTLRNGNIGVSLNADGDLTLSDVTIRNNQSYGILTSPLGINQLTIEDALIESNSRGVEAFSFGGGLYLQGTGNVTITDSTIRDNIAGFGGAIYLKGTTLTLLRSTVSNNSSIGNAQGFGGFGGGGILVSSFGSLTAINSTISGNRAVISGGGIVIDDGTVSLYNSTVTDNHADSDLDSDGIGGGIIATTIAFSTTNVLNLQNSIIAGNTAALNLAADCSSTNVSINSFGYNLIGDGSDTDCLITAAAGDLLGTAPGIDPKLGPLARNSGNTHTHALLLGSPALDAGNPGGCEDASAVTLDTDQRGFTRPLDGGSGSPRCDIGALEMFLPIIPNAGPDQVVLFGEQVTLDGTASSAFQGIFSYSWSEKPSPSVTLDDDSSSSPSFIAPNTVGDLVFDLTIIDKTFERATDSVTVSVVEHPAIDIIAGVLSSAKKLQKKSSIKNDSKSKKGMKKAVKHLSAATQFYLAGDFANGASQVNKAIADFRKVRKLKSKVKKLIKRLQAID